MADNLWNGLKSMDRQFWKCFFHKPLAGLGFIVLAILVFLCDLLYILLTPKSVRREREETWKDD